MFLSTSLGIADELEDKAFRDQFFRTERETDIPAQIKNLRKLRNLTQAGLAERVGTKQSAICRIERSQESNWELETLVKLAEALDARLSVVIEPYEAVVARYRIEESVDHASALARPLKSAALDQTSTDQKEPRREASNAEPAPILALPKMNRDDDDGTSKYRSESSDSDDGGASPERGRLSA